MDSGRDTPSMGAVANRAFLVEGEPGGDEGARLLTLPVLEGLTSWVMNDFPRERGIVNGIVDRRLTKRGDGVLGAGEMYWMEANANSCNASMAQ